MKNVLVTGGAGFIGSNLVQHLLKMNCEVSVIDDLNDFYRPELKRANLAAIEQAGPIRFYECDICDAERVSAIVKENRPDVLIHLAGRAGVRPSLEQPLLYEKVNVGGTVVLLEACRAVGVERFIFGSSSSIYGVGNRVPFKEDDSESLPISPYAATKVAGEKLCYTYSYLYGIKVACLRFFTVYGPRQRPDLAIRKFTQSIDRGDPIPVFGNGSSSRDYTYVDDIVQGIIAASRLGCSYETFNLGNSSPIGLTTLIETIENELGKKAVIRRLPDQPGDVPITYADISKAQAAFGYCPRTPFPQGIARFVQWYLAQKGAA